MINICFLLIQFIYDYEYYLYKNNNNKKKINNYNIKSKNIHNCFICDKKLSNQTIYRCNDLSFCCENHRNYFIN